MSDVASGGWSRTPGGQSRYDFYGGLMLAVVALVLLATSFLLRNPGQDFKRMAWEDLKLAKREYDARRTR